MLKTWFVAISDVHISLKNLDVSISVLTQALEKANSLKTDLLIAGDLNDTKALMRSEWVSALIDLFYKYKEVKIYILVGNHDLNNKNGSGNSLQFLNLIQNVGLIDEDCQLSVDGVKLGIIPYKPNSQSFIESIKKMESNNVKHLVCHQGFQGAYMGDYVVDESSAPTSIVKSFKTVLTGHYHKTQKLDNVQYFGSPFTVNFGEHLQNKFFWVVEYDTETDSVHTTPVVTNSRRHYQFVWDGFIPSKDQIISSEPYYEGSPPKQDDLVKVVLRGTKEWIQSVSESQIRERIGDCKNIIPIPDIIKQSEVRISPDIIHDPIKVVDAYLNSCKTDLDKVVLREYLMKTCQDVFNQNKTNSGKFIKILSVEAENFLSYEKFSFEYSSRGLTSIEGHDEDHDISTGAGKSAFLDAPTCGIFGITSKDLKVDEIINRKTGKNLFIKTRVATDAGIFTINRYRKHNKHENDLFVTMPNGSELRGKDIKETQKKIEDLLGMDSDSFFRSTYFSQFSAMDKFLSASDTEKKRIISDIADTEIYDSMLSVVKTAAKEIEEKITTKDRSIFGYENQISSLTKNISNTELDEKNYEVSRSNRIEKIKQSIQEFEQTRIQRIEDINKKSQLFEQDKANKIKSLTLEFDAFKASELLSIQQIKDKIVQLNERIEQLKIKPHIPDQSSIDKQIEELESKLKIIIQLEAHLQKIEVDIRFEKTQVNSINQQILEFSSRKDKPKCSLCFQDISHSHIDQQVRALENKRKINESNITEQSKKRDEVQRSLQVKSDIEKKKSELVSEKYEIQSRNNSYKHNLSMADQLESEVKSLNEGLNNRPANPYGRQIEQVTNEINSYGTMIELIKTEKNPHESLLDSCNEVNPYIKTKADLSLQLEDIKLKLKQDSSILSCYKSLQVINAFWKDALHIYIKSYMVDSFLEQINHVANQILKEMFDGILSIRIDATTDDGKNVKEKISVSIFNKNEECSYNSLSGGERCRICFALNLALSKTIKINSGKYFNYVAFDEVLNGLDDVGKSQVMKVLKQLESEYETVFVIDHTTEFKSLFCNSVMVKKSGGISSIVQ